MDPLFAEKFDLSGASAMWDLDFCADDEPELPSSPLQSDALAPPLGGTPPRRNWTLKGTPPKVAIQSSLCEMFYKNHPHRKCTGWNCVAIHIGNAERCSHKGLNPTC